MQLCDSYCRAEALSRSAKRIVNVAQPPRCCKRGQRPEYSRAPAWHRTPWWDNGLLARSAVRVDEIYLFASSQCERTEGLDRGNATPPQKPFRASLGQGVCTEERVDYLEN